MAWSRARRVVAIPIRVCVCICLENVHNMLLLLPPVKVMSENGATNKSPLVIVYYTAMGDARAMVAFLCPLAFFEVQ